MLLERLQNAGFVERERDPTDERSLRVSLEQLGLSVEELESLGTILTAVIAHAKERERAEGDEVIGT